MNKPLVSVVMPVFNVERYVGEAIDSVLAQNFMDFELIIVDDGGSDGSMRICREFLDPRIRIVHQANRGLAGARNTGIAAARGEFVALLDADDRWDRAKLTLHAIHLRTNPHVDVSFSGSRLIDARGRPLRVTMRPKLNDITPADILMRNPVGNGSAPVIRRKALDRARFAHPEEPGRPCWFDERFRQSEDIELWMRMSAWHECRFEGIDGLLTDYRIVGGGLSAQIANQFENWQRAVRNCQRRAPQLIARHGQDARAFQLRYLARRAVQLRDGPFAAALLRAAFGASPRALMGEPGKTLATLAGVIVTRLMPPRFSERLLGGYAGRADA